MNLEDNMSYCLIVYNNNTFNVTLYTEYSTRKATTNQIPTPVIPVIITLIIFSLGYWKYKNKK